MQAIRRFAKATIIGGLLFLIPVAVALVMLRHALEFTRKLAQPIAAHLPEGVVAGVGVATIIAVLILLLVCFVAGLVAQTGAGKRIMEWIEATVLGGMPQYQMIKSMTQGLAHLEQSDGIKPILVGIDDGWQIGYLLERLENRWLVAFVPQAPTPMSGNIVYLPEHKVRPLDISLVEAIGIVKHMGIGSSAALRGVDLTLPPAS